ncbi:hypothetical protein BDF14DRAFT_1877408 [Spinellus fusiger]|nr:hypothetical protein BDF14DRAFT_1877408 [Spinellus fusiger]
MQHTVDDPPNPSSVLHSIQRPILNTLKNPPFTTPIKAYSPTPDQDLSEAHDKTTCFDGLKSRLKSLSQEFQVMNENMNQLNQMNTSFANFNRSFGGFMFGLTANGAIVDWKQAPVKESFEQQKISSQKTPVPSTSGNPSFKSIQSGGASLEPDMGRTGLKKTSSGPKDRKDTPKKIIKKTANRTPAKGVARATSLQHHQFTQKININKIINRLPIEVRDRVERTQHTTRILQVLLAHPDGIPMQDLVTATQLPKYVVTVCVNTLVRSKDVAKFNQKGQYSLYKMDVVRYPTTQVQVTP